MSDFYTLAHIPMGLTDLKGNVLVNVGWQEICTKFHRVNPEACKHCIESDIKLTAGVAPGGYKLYKCKNNMWDVVTPIMVEGQHVGNILSGQFFFDDEPLDYELFRSQARKYDFNEKEYMAALKKVPRLSRKAVDTGMAFFMTFANMISQLSYSNIKLSQSLVERDAVVDALQESEKRERARSEELEVLLDAVPVSVYIAQDPQALQITGNRLSYEWLRTPMGINLSKSAPEGEKPEMFKLFEDGVEIPPAKMPSQLSATGIEINDCELDIVSADGQIRHVLGNARPLRDEQGNLRGSISAFIDITERKKVEEALRESEERLRLLSDNLPDSAVYQCVYKPDGSVRFLYISSGIERLSGVSVQDVLRDPNTLYRQVSPEYLGKLTEAEVYSARELSDFDIEVPTRLPDGQVRWMRLKSRPCRLPDGQIIWNGVQTDITENKQAEEALKKAHENLEKIVEERTAELEKAYNSLKENEKGLSEAQKMAHIGNWSWDFVTGEIYWSDEMYRIFGLNPQKSPPTQEEFLNLIHPDDLDYVDNAIKKAIDKKSLIIDHRIITASGEERTVYAQAEIIFDPNNNLIRAKGIIQDITGRKEADEAIKNIETTRKKEIHHRIKNNLQVISSLLDLQADKFENPKVIEAFRESQNRVISMALIHEELYKGEGTDTLDFSQYIRELAENLFQTYSFKSKNIDLSMDLEENVFLNMDIGIPLGIIVNELISNSLKHAFPDKESGEIRVRLHRDENRENKKEDNNKSTSFTLIVSDSGVGIPENLNIEDLDSLGFQLVTSLVDQLDGKFELKRNNGTEFTMRFTVTEKNISGSN